MALNKIDIIKNGDGRGNKVRVMSSNSLYEEYDFVNNKYGARALISAEDVKNFRNKDFNKLYIESPNTLYVAEANYEKIGDLIIDLVENCALDGRIQYKKYNFVIKEDGTIRIGSASDLRKIRDRTTFYKNKFDTYKTRDRFDKIGYKYK